MYIYMIFNNINETDDIINPITYEYKIYVNH